MGVGVSGPGTGSGAGVGAAPGVGVLPVLTHTEGFPVQVYPGSTW